MRRVTLVGLLLVTYALLRGLWCVLVIPPWQGPDEPMHFVLALSTVSRMDDSCRVGMESEVIRSMASHQFFALTGQVEPDPLPCIIRSSAHIPAPTLYHRILGVWLRLTGTPPVRPGWPGMSDVATFVRWGRVLSVLMHCLSVVLLLRAALVASGRPGWATLVGMLFVAHPQMTFIGACLNSDNLMVLLSSCALFLVARTLRPPSASFRAALVALALLAPIAKRAGFAITFSTLPLVFLLTLRRPRGILVGVSVGCAVLAAVAGALWVTGMGRSVLNDVGEILGVRGWVEPPPHGWWETFGGHFWETFWGSYGWVQCPLPARWLRGIGLALATTLVMVPLGLRRLEAGRIMGGVLAVSASHLLFAVAQVVVVQGMRVELGQGRHAFVGLPGLCMLVATGIWGITPRWAPEAVGLVLLVLGEAALWLVGIPCFLR